MSFNPKAVASTFARQRTLYPTAALLYGAAVFALLPPSIVVLNDDFGYLRSVVETLQHGRPWTNEWLEPWGAGLSIVAAAVFTATHSFYGATYGMMAACAAWSFFVGCLLLDGRGLSISRAVVATLLGLTLPTLFWKQIQFTGFTLYLPCLLTALWAVDRRRWGTFFVAWLLAFSTRQSASIWGILPLLIVARDLRERTGTAKERNQILTIVATGVVIFVALALMMNKTAAQIAVSDHVWSQWNIARTLPAVTTAVIAFLIFRGLTVGIAGGFVGRRTNPWFWPKLGLGTVFVAWWLTTDPRDFIGCEFETYTGSAGLFYFRIVGVLAIAALVAEAGGADRLAIVAAGAAGALLTLRPMVWDYYLLDVAVFGAWSVRVNLAQPNERRGWNRAWAVAMLAVAGTFHTWSVIYAKSVLDRTRVMIDLGVQAIETDKLPPEDASILPFGLMAWYFFPYYAAHEGKGSADLADFGCYLNHDTVLVAWRFSRSLRKLPGHDGGIPDRPTGSEIVRGRFPYFWIYEVEALMYRNASANERPARIPYPRDYRLPRFPRDDAGWRALIETGR